jgi:hypothetical protein
MLLFAWMWDTLAVFHIAFVAYSYLSYIDRGMQA